MTGGSERSFLLCFSSRSRDNWKTEYRENRRNDGGAPFLIVKIDKYYYKIILLPYVMIEVIVISRKLDASFPQVTRKLVLSSFQDSTKLVLSDVPSSRSSCTVSAQQKTNKLSDKYLFGYIMFFSLRF